MHEPIRMLTVDAIDAALPQTQCRRCGYDACRPYAEAILQGEAINRCPPGGEDGVATLARITGRATVPLDPAVGRSDVLLRAEIDEAACIGCTLCIEACPVDAIAGGPKRMHTVIATLCTGCELCLAPCPVDCIGLVAGGRAWSAADARAARERYEHRNARRSRSPVVRDAVGDTRCAPEPAATRALSAQERSEAVRDAIARARARRAVRA
ncbi:MAG TPA: RnfABCDGE type electron transport complex subunit B [Casimicrobiaceae bacterium]|nr:RnfABCDGE type electron transport complex subunit B [Casimicrobiaceae bacterium]